jgi:Protein of unknown function (DUF3592)
MGVARLMLLILGLAEVAAGSYGLRRRHKLARAPEPGTIVDVERHFTGKSDAYFPVLSYRTVDGAEVRTLAPQGRLFRPHTIGKAVMVVYDPAKPARAYIESPGLRYGGIAFIIVGLGFLILAAFMHSA